MKRPLTSKTSIFLPSFSTSVIRPLPVAPVVLSQVEYHFVWSSPETSTSSTSMYETFETSSVLNLKMPAPGSASFSPELNL
jgi:hypothetical protein